MLAAPCAFASVLAELESNDTIATAQNVDGNFSLDFVADIEGISGSPSSTSIPHATVTGTVEVGHTPFGLLDPSDYSDFFSFSVLAGNDIYLDIDRQSNAGASADTLLILFDSLGVRVAQNDDWFVGLGDTNPFHPFISHTALLSGSTPSASAPTLAGRTTRCISRLRGRRSVATCRSR